MQTRLALSASLCVLCLAIDGWAQPATATASGSATTSDAPAVTPREVARTKFARGNDLFDEGRFDDALAEFRSSYEIFASPNSRLMIARALVALGRRAEAYVELGKVIEEAAAGGDPYARAGETAEAEREALEPEIGRVKVTLSGAPEGTVVRRVGGEHAIPDPSAPIVVDPGDHRFVARAPDGREAEATVTVAPGATAEAHIDLEPPAPDVEPEPVAVTIDEARAVPLRTWSYVAGGVGAAGLITFGVFGAMTTSRFSSLQRACPGGQCPPDKQSDIDAGRTFQTVANVGLVVGVVGVAAGATLFVLSLPGHEETGGRELQLAAGRGSVRLRGSF
jgi:hypothetical protein